MVFLALRYLLARKRQSFFILMGIVLGTTAFVGISGLLLGFRYQIIDQLINNDAQVRISSREEFLTEHALDRDFFGEETLISWISAPSGRRDSAHLAYAQGWFERLEADPRVLFYSPQITVEAILRNSKSQQTAKLIGVNAFQQVRVTNIRAYMVEGDFSAIGRSGNRLVMGDGLGKKLGTQVNQNVEISVGKDSLNQFKVVGFFHFGIKAIDDAVAYGAIHDIQRVNQTPSQITDIAVRLTDVNFAEQAAKDWGATSRDKVESWSQANEGFLSVFKTQDFVRAFMTLSILLVAGFGIYNVLTMMVNQKRREIAILRSFGYEPKDISFLFLVQGVLLGVMGGLMGLVFGYLVCCYVQTIPVSPERIISGPGGFMPISFAPHIYTTGFLLALLSAVIASILPARSAGQLTPIEIIRSADS